MTLTIELDLDLGDRAMCGVCSEVARLAYLATSTGGGCRALRAGDPGWDQPGYKGGWMVRRTDARGGVIVLDCTFSTEGVEVGRWEVYP